MNIQYCESRFNVPVHQCNRVERSHDWRSFMTHWNCTG